MRVFIFGIDSATFDIILPLVEAKRAGRAEAVHMWLDGEFSLYR